MSEVTSAAPASALTPPSSLSRAGVCSLLAIVAVLVVVSVPRLRCLARQENQADARATVQLLARALGPVASGTSRAPGLRELLRRPELAGLADVELLAQGKVLRHHGYLFELCELPPTLALAQIPCEILSGVRASLRPLRAVRAWPWSLGSTGAVAYLALENGATLVHDGCGDRWEGLECAGVGMPELTGWRPLPRP